MTYSKTLLTRLKALPDVGSRYKAAKLLGLSQTALMHVENERNGFSDEVVLKMSEMLSLDAVETVLRVHVDSGNCPETRQFWERVLDQHLKSKGIDSKGKSQARKGGEKAA